MPRIVSIKWSKTRRGSEFKIDLISDIAWCVHTSIQNRTHTFNTYPHSFPRLTIACPVFNWLTRNNRLERIGKTRDSHNYRQVKLQFLCFTLVHRSKFNRFESHSRIDGMEHVYMPCGILIVYPLVVGFHPFKLSWMMPFFLLFLFSLYFQNSTMFAIFRQWNFELFIRALAEPLN